MSQPKPIKICLMGQSLASGGAEKAMGLLSFFFESRGIEVHNVIVLDEVAYPFAGKLLNLGKLKGKSNNIFDKGKRFVVLRNFLQKEKFDHVIDFRVRVSFVQEFFIAKLLYNAPVHYTVHSSILPLYFPDSRWKARSVYAKAAGIVAVSQGVKQSIETAFGLRNATVIPNAIDIGRIESKAGEPIAVEGKFIVAAGRMDDDVKQFGKLIQAYQNSSLPSKGIRLVLLGDGKLRKELQRDDAENVLFTGFVGNPYSYFSKAEFFVLSSKREGLPMVILESLASGTPVVSFDCASGPGEMITDRQNGLLVPDQDFGKLIQAMDEMCADADLLRRCKANSKPSVKGYSLEKVGGRWLEYLKINVS